MSEDIYSKNEYNHISTQTTTQVYTGACTLVGISVNTTAAGTITIVDGTSGSTPVVGILASSTVGGYYPFNVSMGSGIRIITGAASDVTVIYRK